MTVALPDDVLRQAGLTERDVLVEAACRLFDTERVAFWPAAQIAGLSRVEFEIELRKRSIAIHRITPEHVSLERDALAKLEGG